MTFLTRFKRFGAGMIVVSGLVVVSHSVFAKDISKDHLAAARAAITALGSTDQFDNIIPATAEQLKVNLIRANGDIEETISKIVDEQALKIAPRRGDLEKEAANIYASAFTKKELEAIAAFYNSEAGKKLLENGPLVTRELIKSAQIWSAGINRDLAENVGKELQEKVGTRPKIGTNTP